MTKLNLLADSQSEMIAGGSGSFKYVTNAIGVLQGNNATTLGLGIWGKGYATTLQGNNSDVFNFVKV
jgi:hypothetical protein